MSHKMKSDDSGSTGIPKIMVFRPTLEDMKDFSKYLEHMESQGAHEAGLAKIIPPSEWVPRKGGYDNINITIKSPIQQVVSGSQGIYQQYNIQKRSMNFKEFKKLANSNKHCTPEFFDYDDLERKYWKNITYNPPIYGADVPGSLTDVDCKEFNINNLNSILDLINESYGVKIMGVNTAYLYFGMWKSTFAWHTEDMDLYSINYLHFGAPKSWYCVPPAYGKKLEKLANRSFNDLHQTCSAFLRHKMTLISPQILKKYSIPYNKITQEYGEFMITFPYAYHAGYNHGLNCAESTNFALPRWVEFGKRATRCHCWSDTVKISMDVFVKRFQPERYDNWIEGNDIGPDPKDPQSICAAPSPYAVEEGQNKTKPKRSKRQLIQSKDGISIECLDEPKCDILDDTESFFNSNDIEESKILKEKRKKPKYSASNSFENEYALEDNGEFSNNLIGVNHFDNYNNNQLNFNNELIQTLNTKEHIDESNSTLFLNGDSKVFKKISTILEELTIRTLQYTENPKAFEDEIKFNLYSSFIEPHCAICSVLRPFLFDKEINLQNLNSWHPPLSSPVLIPKSIFVSKIDQITFIEQIDEQSYLLVCSICKICVHSVCYGIDTRINVENWKCDRCLEKDFDAACCLCPLRGGALKMTLCNQWAHIICALILPNIKIKTDINMKPIDISNVQSFRKSDRMACLFCNKKSNFSYISNYITGYCVQCNLGTSCSCSFHVTCGYREGVFYETNEQSVSFKIMCKKCKKGKTSKKEHSRNLADIDLENSVIAKCNGFYSYAKVIDKCNELLHHVQFVDNTLVDNIKSCDILNRDCEKDQPQIGDPIELIWNKQQLHGKYSGSHLCQIYTVLFDNNVQETLKRDEIYLQNEKLPKRVQIKLIDSFKNFD